MIASHFGSMSADILLNCHTALYTECTGFFAADSNSGWFAQWTVRGDMIDFVVSALTTGWVGIGFSTNNIMVSRLHAHTVMYPHKCKWKNECGAISCSYTPW